jgi:hypothetical protein
MTEGAASGAAKSRGVLRLLLLVASLLVPIAMLASAYLLDRRLASCYGDWGDGQRSAYNWLVGASPFVAAALVFAATVIGVAGTWSRYVLATVLGLTFLACFGFAALVVAYNGGGCG